jgi:hypothetical protein
MPLRVFVGLNDPQELAGVHDHDTPFESLVTIAVMSFAELTWTDVGGAGLKVTEMAPWVMVMTDDTDLVASAADVAMTVTAPALPGAV